MKKLFVFIFTFLITSNYPQTNISPQFSELKGMEDQQGNTHLFYRIYSYTTDIFTNEFQEFNSIYHFDLISEVDTLFLEDYVVSNILIDAKIVKDFDVWNQTSEFWISCGGIGGDPDISAFIERFNGFSSYNGLGIANKIKISKQNDSILFVGGNSSSATGLDATLKSTDGGWMWMQVSDAYEFLSLSPFSQDIFFATDVYNLTLFKTINGGGNFYLADTLKKSTNSENDDILFDVNQSFMYRNFRTLYNDYVFMVSTNQGEPFTWQTKYSSDLEIFISNDESISGTIYLADKKNILVSIDYGNNFNLYKSLDRNIVGIYKKPNSDKLYAATKYKIYEITPDTIEIIKSLPIPEEVLNFYPLAVGNKWVFHHSTVTYDPYPNYSYQIDVKEVLGDTITPNGKHYYKVNDETIWESTVLERVDSSDGKVYRYLEDTTLTENEYVAYDLLAEVGDTVNSFRMGFNTVMFTTMYAESTFEKWGLNKPKKVFEEYTLHPPIFSIAQDIGLDSIYFYFDFGDTWITLKGCLVNGVLYGDTTVVSVDDEITQQPIEFSLSHNYPNPFNPSTKIRFSVPQDVRSQTREVTLKVYDVLGNEITTLVNEEKSAGEYEIEFNATGLPSGVYFYQLKVGSFIQTKKMVLLK